LAKAFNKRVLERCRRLPPPAQPFSAIAPAQGSKEKDHFPSEVAQTDNLIQQMRYRVIVTRRHSPLPPVCKETDKTELRRKKGAILSKNGQLRYSPIFPSHCRNDEEIFQKSVFQQILMRHFAAGRRINKQNLLAKSRNWATRKSFLLSLYQMRGVLEVVGDPGIEPGVSRLEGVTIPCHTLRPVAQSLLWGWIICPARGVNGQMRLH